MLGLACLGLAINDILKKGRRNNKRFATGGAFGQLE